jgi:tetratricopeptide (TPR) repeat protein
MKLAHATVLALQRRRSFAAEQPRRGLVLEQTPRDAQDGCKTDMLRRLYTIQAWIRSVFYLLRGNPGESLRISTGGLVSNPTSPSLLLINGSALEALGDLQEAKSVYERCMQVNPMDSEPVARVAEIMREKEMRYAEAAMYYRRSLTMKDGDVPRRIRCERLLKLAFCLQMMGREEEVEQICREVLYLRPKEIYTYVKLSWLLQKQGRTGEALDMCRSGLRRAPTDSRLLEILRRIQEEHG